MKRCGDLSARRNEITHHIIAISEEISRQAGRDVALQRLPDHSWQSLRARRKLTSLPTN